MFLLLCLRFSYHLGQRCNFIIIDHNPVDSFALNSSAYCLLKCIVEFQIKLQYLFLNFKCTNIFKFFKLVDDIFAREDNIWVAIFDLEHCEVNEGGVLVLFK